MKDKIEEVVKIIKNEIAAKIIEEGKGSNPRFWISDSHFDDDRLNLYGRDLIFKNSKEVDDFIVKKCNETLPENATLYHLGDVSLTEEGLKNINRIKCKKKILIKGNYDISKENGGTAKFEINDKILSKYFDEVYDDLEIEIGGEKVYLNHFPINAKPDMMNICGHVHKIFSISRNSINVGLDIWHFIPLSEERIKFQINGIKNHYDQNCFPNELISSVKNRVGKIIILRAPEEYKVATFEENKDVFVFLAGPIQGSAEWQEEFIKKLEEKFKNIKTSKNIVICSPRRIEKFDKNEFDYNEQVNWESFYLNKAANQGVIVFWLAKEVEKIEGRSYSQTSRFELGEWFARGQNIEDFSIVIGAQPGFEGTRYIEKKFKDINSKFELISNVDDMVNEIAKQIKNKLQINE